ncbi:EthD domain-containing protein [Novosphingobium sp. KCTC 2891]|uniref:EthD domain-containing protein n=1 Tax=Novosphingobium sp. KCTC 2891 TaxID=2989730 RepID=UPI0022235163|nr:EthD domain-containing protein [Novosphingobium sp. KCTC 2891]MCW1383611.1 EthD domain-containing protein [Novosphingobium sp. KCTC 2891]
MIKTIYFLKRKPGITPEEFRAHYESSHVLLAEKYIGHLLQDYIRNYPTFALLNPSNIPAGTVPAPYDIDYDCITEMHVADQAAIEEMTRIFNDPAINPILVEDELKFLDRDKTVMIMVDVVNTGIREA